MTAPTQENTSSDETDVKARPPAQKKARRRKTRFHPFSETTPLPSVTVPPSDHHVDMVLFRPVGKRSCFLALSQDAIAAQLSSIDGAHRVRVNFRCNVVAVDALPGADL